MIPRTKPTATVALLFWLMLVLALTGVTFQRLDALDQVGALWIGTFVGAAGGQLVGKLRIRAWVFGALAMVALWAAPVFFFMIYDSVRTAAELCVFAFAPAFACGYFSLSERWGLASFWYPAMLWMLVVLDGGGRFDAVSSLPLLLGLGAMFMAFFRARETRRVALWQSYGLTRLAKPVSRQVLRVSPARAASQWIFTGLVGSAALGLTAVIAPQLWHKEQAKHEAARVAAAIALSDWYATRGSGEVPCCKSDELVETTISRPREYVALRNGTTDEERRTAMLSSMSCRTCSTAPSVANNDSDIGNGGYGWNSTGHGGGSGSGYGNSGNYGGYGNNGYVAPQVTPPVNPYPLVPSSPPATVVGATPKVDVRVHPNAPAYVAPTTTTAPLEPVGPFAVTPVNDPIVARHHAPRRTVSAPLAPTPADGDLEIAWGPAIGFGLLGFGAHLFLRAMRRQLRLRHLAKPFWPSSIDQRISNLWERMLIGLRDAGIRPRAGEQPQALAKRIGLPGMDVCATILERVRHGVRLETSDLQSMQSASTSAFDAARSKAGAIARAASLVRPLT